MTATIAPILGGLFLILALGALLRFRGGMGTRDADTLNRIIMDVTMPALIVHALVRGGLHWRAGTALAGTTAGLIVAAIVGTLAARLLGADKKAQGSAVLVSAFGNTGFLGFPLIIALYPGDETAASTALLVDTVNTTLMLWTVGLPLAARLASAGSQANGSLLRLMLRPLFLSLVVGVALGALGVKLPAFLDATLDTVGRCTSPLVFLSLGLQLDPAALRGRVLAVGATAAAKLVLAPVVCLALVRLIDLPEPVASVAVLQAGMPSAMASVIVAAETGSDRAFAAGAATLTTVLCVLSLPALGWLLAVQ